MRKFLIGTDSVALPDVARAPTRCCMGAHPYNLISYIYGGSDIVGSQTIDLQRGLVFFASDGNETRHTRNPADSAQRLSRYLGFLNGIAEKRRSDGRTRSDIPGKVWRRDALRGVSQNVRPRLPVRPRLGWVCTDSRPSPIQ